jgi:hypothetical protein
VAWTIGPPWARGRSRLTDISTPTIIPIKARAPTHTRCEKANRHPDMSCRFTVKQVQAELPGAPASGGHASATWRRAGRARTEGCRARVSADAWNARLRHGFASLFDRRFEVGVTLNGRLTACPCPRLSAARDQGRRG